MKASIIEWDNNDLKGKRSRIFKMEVYGHIRLSTSPNNIAVMSLEPIATYEFIEKRMEKKIKKGTEFIVIDGTAASLPFDFVFKEICDKSAEEYIAIIFRT